MIEKFISKHKGIRILIIVGYTLYILAVAYLCFFNVGIPDMNLGDYWLGIRKDRIAQFLMFFPFTFLSYLLYKYTPVLKALHRHSVSMSFLTGVLIAAATEIIQKEFIPGREGDVWDFVADVTAITLATIILIIYHQIEKKKDRCNSSKDVDM